jgi:1-acyl-sn-glycerol-3-phosphate acyltransferase
MLLRFVARVFRLLLAWIELTFFTLFLYILSYLPRRMTGDWYFYLFRVWCGVFVNALGVNLYLHQKNTRPLPRKYILISNHPSMFEDVGIPALFPVRSLAKAEVADWWVVGRITVSAGNLYVKREQRESRREAANQIMDALEQGKNIGVYPEGGCKGRRLFSSFRYGAFDISLQTGVPILPVFLHYEAQERFEWREPFTLIHMIWRVMTSPNNNANCYVYDAVDPAKFNNKEEYTEYVYQLFRTWQARYLE